MKTIPSVIRYKENNIEIVFTPTQMICSQRTCNWKCEQCRVGRKAIKKWREIMEGRV